MKYIETKPAADHSQYVECYWQFHTENIHENAPTHVIVPDGAVSLSYIFLPNKQAFVGLTGPSLLAHKISLVPGATYAGIRIRPGVAGSVLGANIYDYRDKFGPQIRPQPEIVKMMQAQLTDQPLVRDLPSLLRIATELIVENAMPLDDPVCEFANAIMQACGGTNLGELSAPVDISPRQLRRRFKTQCGLTPKEFSRLRRVRKTCIELLGRNDLTLADAASQSGFADQAHMTREFTEVFGNSTALVEIYLKQIAHGSIVENLG